MLSNSPCKGCTRREGLSCKRTCREWAAFEEQKDLEYKRRLQNGSTYNSEVGTKARAGDARKKRLNLR